MKQQEREHTSSQVVVLSHLQRAARYLGLEEVETDLVGVQERAEEVEEEVRPLQFVVLHRAPCMHAFIGHAANLIVFRN